jgi:hypothetical protein
VISQPYEPGRIAEGERPQEDAFDEREHGRGRTDAESQREDDGEGETRRFPQLAKCESKILCERVHFVLLLPSA